MESVSRISFIFFLLCFDLFSARINPKITCVAFSHETSILQCLFPNLQFNLIRYRQHDLADRFDAAPLFSPISARWLDPNCQTTPMGLYKFKISYTHSFVFFYDKIFSLSSPCLLLLCWVQSASNFARIKTKLEFCAEVFFSLLTLEAGQSFVCCSCYRCAGLFIYFMIDLQSWDEVSCEKNRRAGEKIWYCNEQILLFVKFYGNILRNCLMEWGEWFENYTMNSEK